MLSTMSRALAQHRLEVVFLRRAGLTMSILSSKELWK